MANELITSQGGQLIKCQVPALIADAGKPAQTAFDDFLDGACRTENTRRAYKRAISQFMKWALEHDLALAEIRAGDVGRYLKQLAGKTSSKKQHRAALKRFFDILVERHVCLINPAAVARTEKLVVKQGLTPEIEKDEIQTLLGSLQGETLSQLRDRAIIGILIYTACRAGAISKLRRGDYGGRPGNRSVRRARPKGRSRWQAATIRARRYERGLGVVASPNSLDAKGGATLRRIRLQFQQITFVSGQVTHEQLFRGGCLGASVCFTDAPNLNLVVRSVDASAVTKGDQGMRP
ncbi:tyrosine-type recombinase/integrase [Planctomycetaceae bacterium SH139]